MQHEYCRCLCVRGGLGDEALPMQSQRDPQKVIVLQNGTNLEGTGVRTDELLNLVTALEDEEGGHLIKDTCQRPSMDGEAAICTYRTDADLLGDVRLLVDVDLVELGALELLGQLLEDGRDLLAWAAPGRPEVEHGRRILVNLRDRGR